MRRIVELRLFEAFVAVARGGAFTLAADELGMSQSATTRAVQDLERRLGAPLLVRTSRQVGLTREGEHVLVFAEELLSLHDSGLERLRRYRRGELGILTIATIPSCAATLLPGIVSAFLQRNPDVQVRIHDGIAGTVLNDVRRGSADLAVTAVPRDAGALTGLNSRPLLNDALYAVFRRSHAWADAQEIEWAALSGEPFISLGADSSVRAVSDRAFAMAGAIPPAGYEAANLVTVGGLVAAGLGVSALPALVLDIIGFADLASIPLVNPVLERTISVVTPAKERLSPVAESFLAHLLDRPVQAPHGSRWVDSDPLTSTWDGRE